MNRSDAYKTLELNQDASDDEIKKAFRTKAAKTHPDVNKDPDAEANFKKINEAYQILTNKTQPESSFNAGYNHSTYVEYDVGSFGDLFDSFFPKSQSGRPFSQNPFQSWNFSVHTNAIVNTSLTISFVESILGCQKEVSFTRKEECETCNAAGVVSEPSETKCSKCDGRGYIIYNGEVTSIKSKFPNEYPCTICSGTGRKPRAVKKCKVCSGARFRTGETITKIINIQPGIGNPAVISFTDVRGVIDNIVNVTVKTQPDPELGRVNKDVVSSLKLSLLEALEGTTKEVNTIKGKKSLKIQPGIKNMNEIKASGLGVPPHGNHIFLVDIEYPEDTSSLIEFLKQKKEGKENV